MTVVTIHKAKTELSKLLARVEAGEEIVIARGDEPIARLVPFDKQKQPVRGYGRFAHLRDKLPTNLFLEPMSEDELQAWEGKYSFPGDNGQ
ncbi:antitoxin of toxin-antitoxin stability system [Agrobacterium albertimagni AOL15]|uniref:Antitoxin n=1 Tax=Agrobacterium albertimagni AOL15 TaxID=1156935 RepID=K2QSE0_9HYPH|nr:type II toxin-antitoxin system prevent-host-death family antitoxin [Agrobacterium albertimagni]EKF57967.1 antitoxin of toxin-antitoxin stability system [Agrobacterium albertimagni AOL15]